ncbi:diguanylate cyclase [Geodermatophilus sp. Leaf369]|uniref:putative bifunctional diguanylate cyclase/phosphodiesterase n=1 Tax=Geodermatophilus sp. Leaf369 TaxID=1736354 RepID=UPI0006FE4E98|nr:EAL domain-containing protein [Geodermatophilus sp. Leaf369]KQS59958.1 diguanylate cyclase [Geodermatophilus sp. Leaf369]
MHIAHPVPAPDGDAAAPEDPVLLAAAVLDALPAPTVLVDPDGTVLLTNPAWEDAVGALGEDRVAGGVGSDYFALVLRVCGEVSGRPVVDALRTLSRAAGGSVAGDHPVEHPTGTRWYHLRASRAGARGRLVVTHGDVTDRVLAGRLSSWRARHDDLTALPNRAALRDLVDAELRQPDRPPVTVLLLDVDDFKDVNDCLGHDAGDDLLRQIAGRLVARTRPQDSVGRLGGDEFVVLCRDCDPAGGVALAERFRALFDEPFQVAGRTARVTVGIGVASGSGPAADLVGDADLAVFAAKRGGRNRVRVFSADLRDAVQQKVQVAAELREAIGADQLVLHYEPIVHLRSGRVHGVEALVRWQHPERGLLPPADFIAVAEGCDLIVPLTRWVLSAATRQAARWAAQGLPLVVSVNVSAASLVAGSLAGDVAAALAAAGLPPERLIVELTETAVAEDPERAAAQFAAVRRSGVEVAIDDFGSGFSSLGQLVTIPAGILKIDRSLVAGAADRRSRSAAAVAAVVALAEAVGMRALAEGVETADQLAVTTALGCALAQGHHIARPMPPEDLADWVRHRTVERTRAGWRSRAGRR